VKTRIERTTELFEKRQQHPEEAVWYRNCIVEENIRLVNHVLKQYKPYTQDQFQAGCIGLIVAVDTFNDCKGVPFPNYACFCIAREIHKLFRVEKRLIENMFNNQMVYLDDAMMFDGGDEISWADIIPDEGAEEEFNAVLNENSLKDFFDNIVTPSIDSIANATKGQDTKIDLEQWKQLEIRYILGLAEVHSQKIRFNFTQMAKLLDISISNVRNRHHRVMTNIKELCKERGLLD
jgi:RNA polymerase sporulation-specific sigma factor